MHKIKHKKQKSENRKFIWKKNHKLTKQGFFIQNQKSNIKNKKPKIPNSKKEPQTHKKPIFNSKSKWQHQFKTIHNQIMKNSMKQTLAGQAGKPFTLARTRSPNRKCPFSLALFAPRRRAGGMTRRAMLWKNCRKNGFDRKNPRKSRGGAAGGWRWIQRRMWKGFWGNWARIVKDLIFWESLIDRFCVCVCVFGFAQKV